MTTVFVLIGVVIILSVVIVCFRWQWKVLESLVAETNRLNLLVQKHDAKYTLDSVNGKPPETVDCITCGCMVKKSNAVAGPDRIENVKGYPTRYFVPIYTGEKEVVNDWYCKRCAPTTTLRHLECSATTSAGPATRFMMDGFEGGPAIATKPVAKKAGKKK